MADKKRILLKLTGEAFLSKDKQLNATTIVSLIDQIKDLEPTHQFGIVVGGGNFFKGNVQGAQLGMTASSAHQVGILATMLNGVILKDLLEQHEVKATIFCAIECPQAGAPVTQQGITASVKKGNTIVFTGGTGNPFFTTDTNAVLRGLQMEADEIWKGTKVDGVYDKDPRKYADATRFDALSYKEAIANKLGIMDQTAFALAEQYEQIVRVFDIFTPDALIQAAQNDDFGTLIT